MNDMTVTQEPAPASCLDKGVEVDLNIEKLVFGGKALGRVAGFVVLVDRAIPGQRVRVRITRKKAQFAEARVVQVLSQSPAYAAPCCRHFGYCGGCQWQDIAYEEQLHWKWLHVQECFQHLGGLRYGDLLPPVASPQQFYYRNKMEFAFAPVPWLPPGEPAAGEIPQRGSCAAGLHVGNSFDRVFNLEECFLQSPQSAAIVREARRWCRQSGLPAYNSRTQRGYWRFLMIREGKRTGQTLVHLITAGQGEAAAGEALAANLMARFPAITTLVHSRNRKKAQGARGEVSRNLLGPGHIEEHLGERRFLISPYSFFQTNTEAAEGLYNTIGRLGEFTGKETVWDLYCGAGSIALFLAPQVRRVVGFELIQEAVNDAYVNSRLNGIDHCQFIAGDLKERIRETMQARRHYPRPDVVITDPPRAGMHLQVVQALREMAPRRLIYVSCNPATLARDLALLQDQYQLLSIQPFDFFPQTAHIECVACLERRQPAAA